MQQWEYDHMILRGKLRDMVDSLDMKGSQGWELAAIITKVSRTETSIRQTYIAIFKRPLTD
jgi:hypothetical protein